MSVDQNLTAEEQLLYERLGPLFEQERLRMAKALASQADSELFGANEYEMRDRVHKLGGQGLGSSRQRAAKKGAGTWVLAVSAPIVEATPSSSLIDRNGL